MLKLYVKQSNVDTIVATWEGDGTVKHEIINNDYVNVLVGKIRNRKPNVVEFQTVELELATIEALEKYEIYIDTNDKAFYDEVCGYNKLDKDQESSSVFELIVSHAYNHIQAQILNESGYTYEMSKLEDNKVRFIVNS